MWIEKIVLEGFRRWDTGLSTNMSVVRPQEQFNSYITISHKYMRLSNGTWLKGVGVRRTAGMVTTTAIVLRMQPYVL